jgi:hypothetical protein
MIGRNMWWGNDRLNFVERHIAGCLNVKGEGAGVLVGPD